MKPGVLSSANKLSSLFHGFRGAFITANRDLFAANSYLDTAVRNFPITDRTF